MECLGIVGGWVEKYCPRLAVVSRRIQRHQVLMFEGWIAAGTVSPAVVCRRSLVLCRAMNVEH